MGNLCRVGSYIDRKFAWLDERAWDRKLGYAEDSLVSDVTVSHGGLGISVRFEDYIDLARNWFIRNLSVTFAVGFTVGRVFLHYDWYIEGSDIGNTVLYDPRHRGVIAYKANRYFLVGGQCDAEYGVSTWANGKKGNGLAGTWVDAEDGVLGKNPIEQGSIDCTIGFDLGSVGPDQQRGMTHWLCMGTRLSEVTTYGQELIVGKGQETYRDRTLTYWQVWSEKDHRHIDEELGTDVTDLYRRSGLTARSHVDNGGAVIASSAFDMTKFASGSSAQEMPAVGGAVFDAHRSRGRLDGQLRRPAQRAAHPLMGSVGGEVGCACVHGRVGVGWAGCGAQFRRPVRRCSRLWALPRCGGAAAGGLRYQPVQRGAGPLPSPDHCRRRRVGDGGHSPGQRDLWAVAIRDVPRGRQEDRRHDEGDRRAALQQGGVRGHRPLQRRLLLQS